MATSSSKTNKSVRETTTAQSVIGGLSADILDDVHEDTELRDRVVIQLRHSRIPMFQKLQIEVRNGEVRVTGTVETTFDKQLLARSLKQISGVKIWRLDSVKILPPPVYREPLLRRLRELPFIEQGKLWEAYDTSVTWSDPANLPVSSQRIATYECPTAPKHNYAQDHLPDGFVGGTGPWTGIVATGDYAGSLGVSPQLGALSTPTALIDTSTSTVSAGAIITNGFLPKNSKLTLSDIPDGVSNTVAVWESGARPFVYRGRSLISGGDNLVNHHTNAGGWVRPASDILLSGSSKDGTLIPATTQAATLLNRTNGYDHATETYSGTGFPAPYGTEGSSQPYSFHTGGVNALFGDGRVKLINEETPIGIVAALVTRNGGRNDAQTPEGSY